MIREHYWEMRGQPCFSTTARPVIYCNFQHSWETRALNQAVKRNADRFPEDFMFQMTDEEVKVWKSQIVISNSIKMGIRRNPYVFTELGVAMLSSVLTSKIAIQVNIGIMKAFVAIRQMIGSNPLSLHLSTLEKSFE